MTMIQPRTKLTKKPPDPVKIAQAAFLISVLSLVGSGVSLYFQWEAHRLAIASMRPLLVTALKAFVDKDDKINVVFSIQNDGHNSAVIKTLKVGVGTSDELLFAVEGSSGAMLAPNATRDFSFNTGRFHKLQTNGATVDLSQTLKDTKQLSIRMDFMAEQDLEDIFTSSLAFPLYQ
jgi:hypothetical protein